MTSRRDPQPHCNICSKENASRLIRKMIIEGIIVEETQRQDNQYASLSAKLRVNNSLAARLVSLPGDPIHTVEGHKLAAAYRFGNACVLSGAFLFCFSPATPVALYKGHAPASWANA